MGTASDRVEMIACPACGKEVSSQAPNCPACGQPVRPAQKSEAIGLIMLLLPFVGTGLIWLWVGEMNLLQRPDDSLQAIVVGVVALSAVLAAVEAGMLGVSAVPWFFGVALVWFIGFPGWLNERAKHGMRNLAPPAILGMLMFLGSAYMLHTAIVDKATQIQRRLGR